jgi:hypothetical protein
MPRTLDAALLAAMNAGGFTPWFYIQLLDAANTVLFDTDEVTGFEINSLSCKVSFHDPTHIATYHHFRILRGVKIAGVPNYIRTSNMYPFSDRSENRIRTIAGHVFPNTYYSTPADVTYREIIGTVCTAMGLANIFEDDAAAWLDYQFYPTGRTFILNNVKQFFTILRQKYLIFATDTGIDQLYFYQAKATGPIYPAGYTTVTPGLVILPGEGSVKYKSFLSRDENGTTHTSGDPNDPIHNLGFLPSTAAHPDRTSYFDTSEWVVRDIAPNLKYFDFDAFRFVYDNFVLALWPAIVREIYDKKLHPAWQWQVKYLDVFGNTEGGTIPSTIEAAAPYTPLNVSNFDKNLNSSVNNLQALADRVDELDTGPSINAGTALDPPDDADLFPVVDVSLATPAVKKITWAQIKARLTTLFSSLYLKLDGSGAMTGNLDLGNNALKGGSQYLLDDTAANFTPGDSSGVIFIFTLFYSEWAIMIYKSTSINILTIISGGTDFTASIDTQLAGTTGADGKLNVSVDDATGKMYFENRMGTARSFRWVLIVGG